MLYFAAIWQVMLQHMLVVSYDSAEPSLIGTLEHFCHLRNVDVNAKLRHSDATIVRRFVYLL